MPLSSKPRRIDVYDDQVAMMINGIIDQANRAMASARLDTKLQFCLDLAKQNRGEGGEENQRFRDVEYYFQARIEGQSNISGYPMNQATDPGRMRAGYVPLKVLDPSCDRLGERSRYDPDLRTPGPYDGAARWAASGAVDRLRDQALVGEELQTHQRPLTRDRTISAFPRVHTD
jgi:hypothetical protein